jgi:hypothetical protein
MSPVSLDCPFLIAPLSPVTLDCPFLIAPMSPVTLDCPFLIAPMSPVTLDCPFLIQSNRRHRGNQKWTIQSNRRHRGNKKWPSTVNRRIGEIIIWNLKRRKLHDDKKKRMFISIGDHIYPLDKTFSVPKSYLSIGELNTTSDLTHGLSGWSTWCHSLSQ